MAPRPYWKGYLKLSLVSCPIALHTATSGGERIAFRQINKQTGNRLRQQLVDEVTREPVESADKGRGYEYAKGAFIPVEDEELDAIAIESNHTIEIDTFVPHAQIDERYFDASYYVTPNDEVGQDAFVVIRDAMRGKGMVALGRVVLAKRERVIMLQPWDKGIMGTTLHYPYEIRSEEGVFEEIPDLKLPDQMVGLAEDIIDKMSGEFEPDKFEDRYENAMIELIRSKQAGLPLPKEKPSAPPANVVNLMDALRRSIEDTSDKKAAQPASKKVEAVAKPKRRAAKG